MHTITILKRGYSEEREVNYFLSEKIHVPKEEKHLDKIYSPVSVLISLKSKTTKYECYILSFNC